MDEEYLAYLDSSTEEEEYKGEANWEQPTEGQEDKNRNLPTPSVK